MQQALNFNSRQILSKEELQVWDKSLRELLGNVLRYNRGPGQVAGILDGYDVSTSVLVNDFFKTEVGSIPSGGFDTLKIGEGRAILQVQNTTDEKVSGLSGGSDILQDDQLVTYFKWPESDNIPVAGISGYVENDVVYVGFLPIWNPLEDGVCSISASSNQVTITGGDFLKLRGQSTKNPTKIRFYNSDGSPATMNNDTYEVVSIISSTQIIISGELANESNLSMLIVGSYDLAAQGSISDKYSYRTAKGELTFTKTATDIINNGGFIIASLLFGAGGAFSVTDLRLNYLFNFAYSTDVMYKSLAQVVTGQKIFTTAQPVFKIPKVDFPNAETFSSPLTIPVIADPLRKTIVIPSTAGSVFKIKAGVAYGTAILSKIIFDEGYAAGTRLNLLLDPTGKALNIWPMDTTGSVVGNIIVSNQVVSGASDVLGTGGVLTILPGNFIELWADENLNWHVMNYLQPIP